ncbi:MAG: peptidylprolyl isomerase [Clostridium sp.]
MKKINKLLGLVIVAMFAFTGCTQIVETEQGKSKQIVATVYGENITKADFEKRFESLLINIEHQYKKQAENDKKLKSEGKEIDTKAKDRLPADKETFIKQQKEKFLSDLTQEKVYLYNAKKKKIEVTTAEINKAFKEVTDNGVAQYGDMNKFKAEVKAMTGLEFEQYEAFIKESLKLQLIQPKLQQAIIKDVKVTDEEAKADYNNNPYKYTEKPNMMYFTHIVVDKKEEADKIKKELDNGADMGKLAEKYSTDPGSNKNGGKYDKGLEYSGLDPAFLTAALKLKIGEISAPVQGQHGYYIIKVQKKEDHPKKAFDLVKEEAKKALLQQKQMTATQTETGSWEKESKIKTFIEKL